MERNKFRLHHKQCCESRAGSGRIRNSLSWSDPDSGSNHFHLNICVVYEFFLAAHVGKPFLDYTHIFSRKSKKTFKVLQLQLFKWPKLSLSCLDRKYLEVF